MARTARLVLVSGEVGVELVETSLVVDDPVGLTVLVTTVLAGAAVTHTVLYTVLVSVACDCSGGAIGSPQGVAVSGALGFQRIRLTGLEAGQLELGLNPPRVRRENSRCLHRRIASLPGMMKLAWEVKHRHLGAK